MDCRIVPPADKRKERHQKYAIGLSFPHKKKQSKTTPLIIYAILLKITTKISDP